MAQHQYNCTIDWTGNKGYGTSSYTEYDRSYTLNIEDKETIDGSSDPKFRGDAKKINPEELLLASVSSCHMLWYLHLCADKKIVVVEYKDHASGVMVTNVNGSGRFEHITLKPVVTVAKEEMTTIAASLHTSAHKMCFIANSVNFEISVEPTINVQ